MGVCGPDESLASDAQRLRVSSATGGWLIFANCNAVSGAAYSTAVPFLFWWGGDADLR